LYGVVITAYGVITTSLKVMPDFSFIQILVSFTSNGFWVYENCKNSCVTFHTNPVFESSNRVCVNFTQEFVWIRKKKKKKKKKTKYSKKKIEPGGIEPGVEGWQPKYVAYKRRMFVCLLCCI
jgi:hypothetical protein